MIALASSPYLELVRQSAALEKSKMASNIPDAIESLRNGSVDAFLAETPLLVQAMSNSDHECKLSVVRSGLFKQQVAFALNDHDEFASSHEEALNVAIQAALTDGIVLRQYLTLSIDGYKCTDALAYAESLAESNKESSNQTPLDYSNMGGIFIIVAVGGMTALALKTVTWFRERFRYGKVTATDSAGYKD